MRSDGLSNLRVLSSAVRQVSEGVGTPRMQLELHDGNWGAQPPWFAWHGQVSWDTGHAVLKPGRSRATWMSWSSSAAPRNLADGRGRPASEFWSATEDVHAVLGAEHMPFQEAATQHS